MRILIVNTSERAGGAAVAASRLMEALNNNGEKARMLVRDKTTDSLTVLPVRPQWLMRWRFLWERLTIFCRLRFQRKHLFEIDTATCGTDITKTREFREADVIHLHWVNQGMLSLKDIGCILRSGKPVVWTMHDIWPATSLCHLTFQCRSFRSACRYCPYLPGGGSEHDLSAKVWRRKQRMLEGQDVFFVACSRWLENEAKGSALLKGQHITSIPNPIDSRIFYRRDKAEARRKLGLPQDKKLLLFVAQRVTNVNKGVDYLLRACQLLADGHDSLKEQIGLVVMGGHADEVTGGMPFASYALGYVSDEHAVADIYNAVDAFVLPSLSENLPNTIMEAMACGVPCVGFRVGGIPEEIDHQKNGYVAAYRDAEDLCRGLRWVLCEADHESLSRNAVSKVAQNYSQSSVALKYIEVYNQALAFKHYKI